MTKSINIKSELNDYYHYLELLEHKRSSEYSRLIESYITNEPNILNRIEYIKNLDKEKPKSKPATARTEKSLPPTMRPGSLEPLKRVSLFSYLFSKRKSMKDFGIRTKVFEDQFFNLKISFESKRYYLSMLEKAKVYMLKPLNEILSHGWNKLDRKMYNLLVVLSKFLTHFIHAGNILEYENIAETTTKLDKYIRYYLQIIGINNNKKLISKASNIVMDTNQAFKKKNQNYLNVLDELIKYYSEEMCFANIILGIHMLRFRRFIYIEELIEYYHIQDIDDQGYDLDPSLSKAIKNKFIALETMYRETEKEVFILRYLDEDFHFESKADNPIAKLIFNLLNHGKITANIPEDMTKKETYLTGMLKEFALPFIKIMKGFKDIYGAFLKGKMVLKSLEKNQKSEKIFEERIFANELSLFYELLRELEDVKLLHLHIPVSFSVYCEYVRFKKLDVISIEKVCSLILDIITLLDKLAEKIDTLLYNHYAVQNLKGEDMLAASQLQNSSIDKIEDKPRYLPFAMAEIVETGYLNGQTVLNSFQEIILFIINFCHLLKYEPLYPRILKKQKFISITDEYFSIKSKVPS